MKTSSAKTLRDVLIVALIVGSAAGFVLLCVVVPKIAQGIVQERRTIPFPTQVLFAVSAFATSYWWLLASGVALLALGIARWFRSDPAGFAAVGRHLRRHVAEYALTTIAVVAFALAMVGFALLLPTLQIR